jgi:hypothetical protein
MQVASLEGGCKGTPVHHVADFEGSAEKTSEFKFHASFGRKSFIESSDGGTFLTGSRNLSMPIIVC